MLNKNDLYNIMRIIDSGAERGMYKGQELSTVGQLRDKIVAAIDAADQTPEQELVINTDVSGK